MNFAFSDEQEEFRETLRRFLEERAPIGEVRRAFGSADGFDRTLWKQMAGELGLQGLAIPEAHGGQGFGFLELGIALEEMGRALAGGPFFATVCLAARALGHGADEAARRELLAPIAAGASVATLALAEAGGRPDPDAIATRAERDGSGWRLRGEKGFVPDGAVADLLLVAARRPGTRGARGLSLFAVRGDAEGVRVEPLPVLDPTRRQARLVLADAPARLLGEEGAAWPALARTLDEARVALAAEMVGGAARCLETAVEYAGTRLQFARPIGSFQAIKHKAAEVLLELESARSVAYWSWWVAAQGGDDAGVLAEAASLAKAAAAEAYLRAAAENLHVHGGMGVTWEHDAHLHVRRAFCSDVWLGDARSHHVRLAERLGL